MKYPAYMPHAVREWAERLLSSDARQPGARWAVTFTEARLAALVKAGVATWRPEFIEAQAQVKKSEDHLSCINRLLFDVRMKDVYVLLASHLTPESVSYFIAAASSALQDYAPYRKQMREAKEVAREIAAAAAKLATALRKVETLSGPQWPEEFFSTHALLERARLDNGDGQYVPPAVVMPMRIDRGARAQLMDLDERAAVERLLKGYTEWIATGRKLPAAPILETAFDPDRTASVVLALEAAARSFEPAEVGPAHAALASRKGNSKAAYIRAFNWTLGDRKRTPAIINAMAITATVVLNELDDPVTAGDVRSAISKRITAAKRAHVRARFGYVAD